MQLHVYEFEYMIVQTHNATCVLLHMCGFKYVDRICHYGDTQYYMRTHNTTWALTYWLAMIHDNKN